MGNFIRTRKVILPKAGRVHKEKKCKSFFLKMTVINKPKSWGYQMGNTLQVSVAAFSGLLITSLLKTFQIERSSSRVKILKL